MGILRERRLSGPASFWLTLLLLAPAIISFLASAVLSRAQDFPSSALWFVYNDSLYIGYAGVVIAGIFTVAKGIQGHIARFFVVMMGVSVILAIVLLWYAQHLYRNPWYAVA